MKSANRHALLVVLIVLLGLVGCQGRPSASQQVEQSPDVTATVGPGDAVNLGTRSMKVPPGWSGGLFTRRPGSRRSHSCFLGADESARLELLPPNSEVGAVLIAFDRKQAIGLEGLYARAIPATSPALLDLSPSARLAFPRDAVVALVEDGAGFLTVEVGSNSVSATSGVRARRLDELASAIR